MKKRVVTLTLISALLVMGIAGTFFVRLGWANPYIRDWKVEEVIPVPEGTKLPVLTISNPQNNSFYASKNILLNFSFTAERSNNISLSLAELYYVSNWQIGRSNIDLQSLYVKNNYSYPSTFSINITDVSEGPRWLQVYAVATAFAYETGHEISGIYYTTYYVAYQTVSTATAQFTVDTTPPRILSLSIQNRTYDTSSIPLVLTADEPISQILYSLDEQTNATVAGNTTLTNLSNGYHNITVYATDLAGNVGSSKILTFTVAKPESFPIMPITAFIATVAIVGAGLMVYFKKHRRRVETA